MNTLCLLPMKAHNSHVSHHCTLLSSLITNDHLMNGLIPRARVPRLQRRTPYVCQHHLGLRSGGRKLV